MSVPVTDEHLALADTVASFARDRDLLAQARRCLDSTTDRPSFWSELGAIGWLGLHLPPEVGGSGFGLLEAAVVAEQLGRAVAPGPFVPTVVVSALIDRCAPEETREAALPSLADGTASAAFCLDTKVAVADGLANGDVGLVLCGAQAQWLALGVGDDVALIETTAGAVTAVAAESLDPSRPVAHMSCHGAAVVLLPGARSVLEDLSRAMFAAESAGVAGACVDRAVGYAKFREQFGRPIGSFQAVKHHCANMYVDQQLAAATVWNSVRELAPDEFHLAAAMAAAVAVPAAKSNAELNIRVHGGIGFTWEEDAHLFLRRALANSALCDAEQAAADVTASYVDGARVPRDTELADEDASYSDEAEAFVSTLSGLGDEERFARIVAAGYAVPHWPPPWGRAAAAKERLAIHRAFESAAIDRPAYGITGWILYALVSYGTPGQIERWIMPGLLAEEVWCQLFSEPEAGSDAAAVRTVATRVEGGWKLNGHKLWTTRAQLAAWGLATVRTDLAASKHAGVTTMAIDMHAPGVDIRPLKQLTGDEEFNEVRLEDVFVPDDCVVGAVGDGWTVARATLAGESSSIGSGGGTINVPLDTLLGLWRERPQRLAGGAVRIGRYLARTEAVTAMNVRATFRELTGHQPGAEGSIPKLVVTDNAHDAAGMLVQLAGSDGVAAVGVGAVTSDFALRCLALAIAGGTSEIKRNQIGERVLGLPREPKLV